MTSVVDFKFLNRLELPLLGTSNPETGLALHKYSRVSIESVVRSDLASGAFDLCIRGAWIRDAGESAAGGVRRTAKPKAQRNEFNSTRTDLGRIAR